MQMNHKSNKALMWNENRTSAWKSAALEKKKMKKRSRE